jgi:hypothetical protein
MKQDEVINLDIPNNGFLNLLCTVENGELPEELDEHLKEQVRLLRIRGGKAKITLTVTVEQNKKFESVQDVSYALKIEPPKKQTKGALMFTDKENGLTTHQPTQGDLGFEPATESPAGDGNVSHLKPKDK